MFLCQKDPLVSPNAGGQNTPVLSSAGGQTTSVITTAGGQAIPVLSIAGGQALSVSPIAGGQTMEVPNTAGGQTTDVSPNAGGHVSLASPIAGGHTIEVQNAGGHAIDVSPVAGGHATLASPVAGGHATLASPIAGGHTIEVGEALLTPGPTMEYVLCPSTASTVVPEIRYNQFSPIEDWTQNLVSATPDLANASFVSEVLPDYISPPPRSSPFWEESPTLNPTPATSNASENPTPDTHGPTRYFSKKLMRSVTVSRPKTKKNNNKNKNSTKKKTTVSENKQRLISTMLAGIVPLQQGQDGEPGPSQDS